MNIKSIRKAKKIRGKTILLRVDFNVPVKNGKILDDYKIISCLKTVRFLLRYKCKVLIITHFGQPKGFDQKYSTKILANRLQRLLGKKVNFVGEIIGSQIDHAIKKLKPGEILMLENLRFYNEEEKNDKKFAKHLASLADIYINNAFAVSHRNHASVCAIKNYLPSYLGLLAESEINHLDRILSPQKPMVAVMGGAKISTKLPLLKSLRKKADYILVGGALANNFLKVIGYEVGRSLVDKEDLSLAREMLRYYKKVGNRKMLLPIDVVVGSGLSSKTKGVVKPVNQVGKKDYILDIGPETVRLYSKVIKKSSSIIWNGPMGMFESRDFKNGTLAIAKEIAIHSHGVAFGVVGGGETIEALKMVKMLNYVDWPSTAGGAMLTYLSGEKMPGLKGLIK